MRSMISPPSGMILSKSLSVVSFLVFEYLLWVTEHQSIRAYWRCRIDPIVIGLDWITPFSSIRGLTEDLQEENFLAYK